MRNITLGAASGMDRTSGKVGTEVTDLLSTTGTTTEDASIGEHEPSTCPTGEIRPVTKNIKRDENMWGYLDFRKLSITSKFNTFDYIR